MKERFSQLAIDKQLQRSCPSSIAASPKTVAPPTMNLKRRGSAPTVGYENINPDLYARVQEFQMKRILKRSESLKNAHSSSISKGANSHEIPENNVGTLLPPVSHGFKSVIDNVKEQPIVIHSVVVSEQQVTKDQNDNSMQTTPVSVTEYRMNGNVLKRLPVPSKDNFGHHRALQSLSARRGMKLNGMTLDMMRNPSASAEDKDSTKKKDGSVNGNTMSKRSKVHTQIKSASLSLDTSRKEFLSNCDPFHNFSKYVDVESGSLNFEGKLSLSSHGIEYSNGSSAQISLDECDFLKELGHGNYGKVSKVLNKKKNVLMAVKEVRLELDETKFSQILMELEVLHECKSPYIVGSYGAFFREGGVFICMEYMDGGSLDNIYGPTLGGIDEPHLAYITNAVINGLKELKDVHNIIHRDVKPSNILCSSKDGSIKLCDFGVSGNLVASMAKTNIGCQSYMAPERIRSPNPDRATYTVQSDVWSLGISILEMALGRYPFSPEIFSNIFSQLNAIVDESPPKLPAKFSTEAQHFVSLCLQKLPERRPSYTMLVDHPWLAKWRKIDVNINEYISERIKKPKLQLQPVMDIKLSPLASVVKA